MLLKAQQVMQLHVTIDPGLKVGQTLRGKLNVIPITGGTVTGKVSGHVISGGADWNTEIEPGLSHVFAKYVIQTDDGEFISVENEGTIRWEEKRNIVTVPRFLVNKESRYHWLQSGVFVGALQGSEGDPTAVLITIYQLS